MYTEFIQRCRARKYHSTELEWNPAGRAAAAPSNWCSPAWSLGAPPQSPRPAQCTDRPHCRWAARWMCTPLGRLPRSSPSSKGFLFNIYYILLCIQNVFRALYLNDGEQQHYEKPVSIHSWQNGVGLWTIWHLFIYRGYPVGRHWIAAGNRAMGP